MVHHVVYIPGLGDSRPRGQTVILYFWKLFGLNVHYFPLGWADKEAFEPKLGRLLKLIDELELQEGAVSLVGVSAGASAVLNAYAKRGGINSVICICGKINSPQAISERTYRINPAFKQSMFGVKQSLDKLTPAQNSRIMSIHPLSDGTVPLSDTAIPGAVEKTAPVVGHIFGIFYSITFGAAGIAKFLKSQAAKAKQS